MTCFVLLSNLGSFLIDIEKKASQMIGPNLFINLSGVQMIEELISIRGYY